MRDVEELIKVPLSGQQVINLTRQPKTAVMSYSDMHTIKDLDELLGETRSVIVLYEWKENYGHWICVFEDVHHNIEVFDSYGIYKPDDELSFIPKDFAIAHKEHYPFLTEILYNSGYPVEYNNKRYQSDAKEVSTCGRYAGVRLFFRNLDLKHFDKLFKYNKKYTPDELITILSELISNNII